MPSQVTIGGKLFWVYGTQAEAVDYHQGSNSAEGIAFHGATPDEQAKALVEATRMINRHRWIEGLTTFAERDAKESDDTSVETRYPFRDAAAELAALIHSDPDLKANPTSGSNVQSVGAGPASVVFFRPTLGVTGRWPTVIKELLGEYMAGSISSTDGVSTAFGTDAESAFDVDDAYGIERSF